MPAKRPAASIGMALMAGGASSSSRAGGQVASKAPRKELSHTRRVHKESVGAKDVVFVKKEKAEKKEPSTSSPDKPVPGPVVQAVEKELPPQSLAAVKEEDVGQKANEEGQSATESGRSKVSEEAKPGSQSQAVAGGQLAAESAIATEHRSLPQTRLDDDMDTPKEMEALEKEEAFGREEEGEEEELEVESEVEPESPASTKPGGSQAVDERSDQEDPPQLPPGPASKEAMEQWVTMLVDTLRDKGLLGNIQAALRHGCTLRTDYSGIGTAEVALSHFLQGLGQLAGHNEEHPDVDGQTPQRQFLTCVSASDCDEHARMLLQAHVGRSAPHHVFGSLEATLSQDTLAKLDSSLAGFTERAQELLGQGFPRGQVYTQLGQEFMLHAAKTMLSQETVVSSGFLQAWCYKCHRLCHLVSAEGTGAPEEGSLSIAAAGVCCYSWSSMGKRNQWLDQASIPFLAWTRLRLLCEEDIILVENVPGFDHTLLARPEFFGRLYHVHVVRSNPAQLGYPASRNRKYIIMVKKNKETARGFHPGPVDDEADEPEPVEVVNKETDFIKIFGKQCVLKGPSSGNNVMS